MKNLLIALGCLTLGFAGVLGTRYVQVKNIPSFVRQPSTFTLAPPSRALSGVLGKTEGTVKILLRENNDFVEASPAAMILQGESLATDVRSEASVSIGNALTLSMGPIAEVTFVNLIPDSMVLRQKSGKVTYDLADNSQPVSVRALRALVSIASGSAVINIIDTDMSVQIKSGAAKLALVDTDNNTHVWELTERDRATIDDATRTVSIR